MATKKLSAEGASDLTVAEKARLYDESKVKMKFSAADAEKYLRDVTKTYNTSINTFDKEELRRYMKNIGSNEKNLRNVSRYLFYRSHIYYRLVTFYANMPDLRCRKVVPKYDLVNPGDDKTFLKNYNDTLDLLEIMNLHGNMNEIFLRCLVDDVCYSIFFMDNTGSFFYILDPDICRIDSRYSTSNFGFSVDMSYWNSAAKQKELNWLGEPLTTMYQNYQTSKEKWQHMDDKYAACFKFRVDDWKTIIPPFMGLFNSYINLADLENIQAIADQQNIYKLIYLPMKTLSGTKDVDDWAVSPDLLSAYFKKMISEALPDYVAAAIIPSDELGVIDFADNTATDTDRVSESQTQILDISGGGMVLNTSKISSNAAFEAALKCETEFILSPLLPQIDGFANMMLLNRIGKRAARVQHFEVSIYTKEALADSLLKSCQYSFANRLAYNTCLGMSEKDTIALSHLENEVLGLPDIMKYPLSSSFTQTGEEDGYTSETGQGAPTKDADDLSDSGDSSRNE